MHAQSSLHMFGYLSNIPNKVTSTIEIFKQRSLKQQFYDSKVSTGLWLIHISRSTTGVLQKNNMCKEVGL